MAQRGAARHNGVVTGSEPHELAPTCRAAEPSRHEGVPRSVFEDHPPIFRAPPPPLRTENTRAQSTSAPRRPSPLAQHARRSLGARIRRITALAAAAVLVVGGAATVTAAVIDRDAPPSEPMAEQIELVATIEAAERSPVIGRTLPLPAIVDSLPVPDITASAAPVPLCANSSFTAALAAHDDASAIAAAGGAESMRQSIASGSAPCLTLANPAHVWVVINKLRPFDPVDYAPEPLVAPAGVRSFDGGTLRADAAAALSAMVAAAQTAGAGEIALASGYRSLGTQVDSYGSQTDAKGVEQADLESARPGFSEHQSGLTGDLVACNTDCGTLDDLAGSPQGQWLAAHSWEYGFITRYENDHTAVTGYLFEPWHLRYIGVEFATVYHQGGWHTLEEFFALPAAPSYAD